MPSPFVKVRFLVSWVTSQYSIKQSLAEFVFNPPYTPLVNYRTITIIIFIFHMYRHMMTYSTSVLFSTFNIVFTFKYFFFQAFIVV